jgi:hypothetical protein
MCIGIRCLPFLNLANYVLLPIHVSILSMYYNMITTKGIMELTAQVVYLVDE